MQQEPQIVQQFEQAKCSQPFSQLGVIESEGELLLRVWRPKAASITITWENPAFDEISLLPVSASGLFQAAIPRECVNHVYRVNVTEGEHQYKYIDPYQFREQAYHAVHFIDSTPFNLFQQAGAQLVTVEAQNGESIDGVRYCVFAPNASAVSVIGDFNQWDGRVHPMEKTSMGYWVLFIPGMAEGERYKYQVKDSRGYDLPTKPIP